MFRSFVQPSHHFSPAHVRPSITVYALIRMSWYNVSQAYVLTHLHSCLGHVYLHNVRGRIFIHACITMCTCLCTCLLIRIHCSYVRPYISSCICSRTHTRDSLHTYVSFTNTHSYLYVQKYVVYIHLPIYLHIYTCACVSKPTFTVSLLRHMAALSFVIGDTCFYTYIYMYIIYV